MGILVVCLVALAAGLSPFGIAPGGEQRVAVLDPGVHQGEMDPRGPGQERVSTQLVRPGNALPIDS